MGSAECYPLRRWVVICGLCRQDKIPHERCSSVIGDTSYSCGTIHWCMQWYDEGDNTMRYHDAYGASMLRTSSQCFFVCLYRTNSIPYTVVVYIPDHVSIVAHTSLDASIRWYMEWPHNNKWILPTSLSDRHTRLELSHRVLCLSLDAFVREHSPMSPVK